jgi:hypothetical protein
VPSQPLSDSSKFAVKERGPAVASALSSPEGDKAFKRHVKAYVDAHSHVLMAANPGRRLFFKGDDIEGLYRILGVSEAEMKDTITRHGLVDPGWKTGNKAVPWLLALSLRQYEIQKDAGGAEHALAFLALSFYTSIQFKYWRFEPTGANEAVMMHVINNLSNKFKLKQHGTILGMLTEIAGTAWQTYRKDVAEGTDKRLLYFIAQVRSRIDDAVHNIASKFYAEIDAGKQNRMYIDSGDNLKGEDGEDAGRRDLDNTSASISKLVDAAANRSSAVGVDRKAAEVSARVCGVSQSATEQALEKIVRQHPELSRELMELILEMYFAGGAHTVDSVGTKTFVFVSLSNYTKSNTSDPAVLRSREILELMLKSVSGKYMASERAATKGNFRKAVFMYHCVLLQRAHMGG